MKRRDLERHLRSSNCEKKREGAKHTQWTAPEGATTSVPRHAEIGPGLVRKICRDLGIEPPANVA
ncbi:MAG: type II toxin-antitoxin system HicA family toxin [Thermoleophilaceae bacterium]|nr:type II toxin-antitoxin system HicA family toxin [Thermoleophilaceae bacterium]